MRLKVKPVEAKKYTLETLPIDTPIRVKMEVGTVNGDGYYAISELLQSKKLPYGFLRGMREAGDMIPWVTKEGKLPKRIAKAIYKFNKTKVSEEILTEIGNVAKLYSITQPEYIVDITQNFDWPEGAFNDDGSCYWGAKPWARQIIHNGKGYAVRTWEDDLQSRGRCWAIPKDGKLFIFNGYGDNLSTFAMILGHLLNAPIGKAYISNNGEQTRELWINGTGYAIGAKGEVDVDFGLLDRTMWCATCNDQKLSERHRVNGESHCDACYAKMQTFDCDNCGYETLCETAFLRDDGKIVCAYCR